MTYPACLSPSYTGKRGSKINGNEQLSVRGTVVFDLKAGQISSDLLHVALYGGLQVYGMTISSASSLKLLLSTMFEEMQGVKTEVLHIRLWANRSAMHTRLVETASESGYSYREIVVVKEAY